MQLVSAAMPEPFVQLLVSSPTQRPTPIRGESSAEHHFGEPHTVSWKHGLAFGESCHASSPLMTATGT